VLFLIGLGIKGCLDARKKQAFKDYGRDVAALLQESDQQSKDLFDLLRGTQQTSTPVDVQSAVNGARVQAEQLVDRAKGISHPGELSSAQRYIEETLSFRRDGLSGIARLLPTALGDQGRAEAANQIAGQMRLFDASDVVYSQRFVPEFQLQLKNEGLTGDVTVPKSQFLPDIEWLRPNVVSDRIARIRGGSSASQPATPGLHGTGLGTVVVKPGGQTLSPTQVADIPVNPNISFDVQVINQGENDEQNVTVTVKLSGAGKPITVTEKLPQIARGETKTVNLPLAATPTTGQPVTINVSVSPVPGEKKTDNNKATSKAVFTSG
jgi:CARDB